MTRKACCGCFASRASAAPKSSRRSSRRPAGEADRRQARHRDPQSGQAARDRCAGRAARHILRRRRRAWTSGTGRDRRHLRRQCRPQGTRGGRPSAASLRSPTTAACASTRCTAAGHILRALGRGRGRQSRLDAGDGEGVARGRGDGARRGARRPFRLLARDRLAQRRPDRNLRRPRRRNARLAAAGRARLRLRPDVRAGRP